MFDTLERLGFRVALIDDSEDGRDARNFGLVVISASVVAGLIEDEYLHVRVPVLVMDSDLYEHMRMTNDRNGRDFGTTNARQLEIEDGSHPIAAGLRGRIDVSNRNTRLHWGEPSAEASVIATLVNQARRATIFAYEADANMEGQRAPHRRVGFFASDQLVDELGPEGEALLEAAVIWTWSGQAAVRPAALR